MINSIYSETQAVGALGNVVFNVDRVRSNSCKTCSGWLIHEQGSGLFELTKCGKYLIMYSANISSAVTGDIGIQLKQNGEFILGTRSDYTVITADVPREVSNFALVEVPCGTSKTITLSNTSTTEINVEDANIIILKVA